ncbi:putative smile protein-like protein, partial [Dinothrombium tinctorium]
MNPEPGDVVLLSPAAAECEECSVQLETGACVRIKFLPRMHLLLEDWLNAALLESGDHLKANSLNGEFVHDDIVAITKNPDVVAKSNIIQLLNNDFWGKPMSDFDSHKSYRPLTTLSF